jgi:hypothetical protein
VKTYLGTAFVVEGKSTISKCTHNVIHSAHDRSHFKSPEDSILIYIATAAIITIPNPDPDQQT